MNYSKQLSEKFSLPESDIPLHIQVANIKNIPVEEYLASLPRSREQFKEYFKGTKWGNIV